jgi:hypothetical protein
MVGDYIQTALGYSLYNILISNILAVFPFMVAVNKDSCGFHFTGIDRASGYAQRTLHSLPGAG